MEYFNLFEKTQTLSYNTTGDDVDYCIYETESEIYLFFEGSRTSRDWQINFNFPRKIYKKQESCIKVAGGWGDAYKSCRDVVMKSFIEKYKKSGKLPYIVGHSLGGALAVIASEDFYYQTNVKCKVITFGAPKCLFGKKTQKYLSECCLPMQFTHVHDMIPRLPPFPGYYTICTDWVGKNRWKVWELFRPKYHVSYGDKELYKKY